MCATPLTRIFHQKQWLMFAYSPCDDAPDKTLDFSSCLISIPIPMPPLPDKKATNDPLDLKGCLLLPSTYPVISLQATWLQVIRLQVSISQLATWWCTPIWCTPFSHIPYPLLSLTLNSNGFDCCFDWTGWSFLFIVLRLFFFPKDDEGP